jgi:hypothetical protein
MLLAKYGVFNSTNPRYQKYGLEKSLEEAPNYFNNQPLILDHGSSQSATSHYFNLTESAASQITNPLILKELALFSLVPDKSLVFIQEGLKNLYTIPSLLIESSLETFTSKGWADPLKPNFFINLFQHLFYVL